MTDPVTILVGGIRLPVSASPEEAIEQARRVLRGVRLFSRDLSFSVYRRSVDARKKDAIRFVYSVAVTGRFPERELAAHEKEFSVLKAEEPTPVYGDAPLSDRPLVVGSGPCGLFCAYLLAKNGYRPILIERGGDVACRRAAVETFRQTRVLDRDTNIQFGAGGAGTFSDGKLVTRINDPLCGYVLKTFVSFGAPEEILTLAKPHVGTDILAGIVENMLSAIVSLGGEVRYHTRLDGLTLSSDRVTAAKTTAGQIPCGALVLAIGHSARDTYEMLLSRAFAVEPKPFSVGVRIEHRQEDIDRALYGRMAGSPLLGHAEYALSANTKVRGVYTFCMCPGGEVVAATSEEGGTVTNGMSAHARAGENANAAVVSTVFKEDYGSTPQGAIAYQRQIEHAAFRAGGGDYAAPLSTVGDFLAGKEATHEPSRVRPTYMGGEGYRLSSPDNYLPAAAAENIRRGIRAFSASVAGFDAPDAILTGAETRTSSPIRLLRTESGKAIGYRNIYPAGEGAGYAGGITSAAIDGIRTALSIMAEYCPFS